MPASHRAWRNGDANKEKEFREEEFVEEIFFLKIIRKEEQLEKERVEEIVEHAQIQPRRRQGRGARDARNEGRQAEVGQRKESDESKAGHRHWTVRGAQVWRKGPEEEIVVKITRKFQSPFGVEDAGAEAAGLLSVVAGLLSPEVPDDFDADLPLPDA
jgi:hypothetical protein